MNQKIYIISQHLQLGGAEKALIQTANALCKIGYEVTIFSVMRSKEILPIDSRVKVEFLSKMTLKKENFVSKIFRKIKELYLVKQKIKTISHSVIITPRNDYNVILSEFGNDTNLKIAQLHHEYTKNYTKDFKKRYGGIDYFVQLNDTVTFEIANMMKKNKRTKVVTIPNFISDIPKMSDIKISEKQNIVVSAAYMRYVKGFDRLVEIWKFAKTDGWRLALVGNGPEYENVKNCVEQNGLSDGVVFTGELSNEETLNIMAKSKIYALPSRKESFGFVIIEAMQNFLPVVAFDARTGPATIIENEKDGFLVSDGDIKKFAEKLKFLMQNENARQKFAQNAWQKSLRYTEKAVIKKWDEILSPFFKDNKK